MNLGRDLMFDKINAKIKTWERGLAATYGTDISTPKGRRQAAWHFQLLDHGFLRALWGNFFEVAPGVWRSNQPSPRRLRKFKKLGFKSVLNLRGANVMSPYLFEQEACRELGLTLVDHPMQARHLSGPEVFLRLLDIFETIEHPFVMHCKSGADRAGIASALYLMHMKDVPIEIAKKQLGKKYIHFKSFQTGILDHMLDAYEADNKVQPMPIRKWLENRYDQQKLTGEFQAGRARP